MAGLPPSEFAARLTGIRDYLRNRAGGESLASVAAAELADGMENIAKAAVKRLKERTPRSQEDHDHIADGWTFRRVETPGGRSPARPARSRHGRPTATSPAHTHGCSGTTISPATVRVRTRPARRSASSAICAVRSAAAGDPDRSQRV